MKAQATSTPLRILSFPQERRASKPLAVLTHAQREQFAATERLIEDVARSRPECIDEVLDTLHLVVSSYDV